MHQAADQRWEYQDYCDAVETEAARFAGVVRGTDPAQPVPTCPGWTMADLIKHHGTSQRRVEYVVRHRSQQPVWSKDVKTGLPENPADYPAWSAAGTKALVTTLRAAGDLLLLSYGRLTPADLCTGLTGDEQLLTQWLESSAL